MPCRSTGQPTGSPATRIRTPTAQASNTSGTRSGRNASTSAHPYRGADGEPYGVELDAAQARRALDESLALEARIRGSVTRCLEAGLAATDSVYSPFEPVAAELGYTSDPTLEPSPFFTTLDGYRSQFTQ